MTVEQFYETQVSTRSAVLLCDHCAPRRHVWHEYASVLVRRDQTQSVMAVDALFRCLSCGTVRQWGRVGPHPEREEVDDE